MKQTTMKTTLTLLALTILSPLTVLHAAEPSSLKTEYRENPLGIDIAKPRLSWIVEDPAPGAKQTAYQVLAASSPEKLVKDEGDLWDSGKVASDQTIHVAYAGKPLQSRGRVWWKVRAWDKDGQPSAWSAPSTWTMGLLQLSDWRAKWIADPVSAKNIAPPKPLIGYHSKFAKTAETTKSVTVDLGQPKSFDAIRLFPTLPYDIQPDTPGFLFPVGFKIEAASKEDFSDARVLVDRTAADEPNPGSDSRLYRFASTTAQFVRLTVTRLAPREGNNFGFALAELQVLNGENNLAKGAKVLALDSLETGPWAKVNLTDGVLTTVKPGNGNVPALPATMVRKSFQLDRPIKRATAYASALGLYELRLNGQRVGENLLAPEWTQYQKRVNYQVHDVTTLLRQGENAVAALLGEGWFAGRLCIAGPFPFGTHPRFLLQLEIEFADGQTETIVTDGSWRTTIEGPIRTAGIYDGEVYDARKEFPGWDRPGFDASSWRPAQAAELDERKLVWQRNEPIQVVKELTPVKMTEPKPGVFVFDFGQNMAGWCRVKAVGAAGQTVTLRHAEVLNDDGTLYTANLRSAQQTDRYTPRADGEFVFEPHFTYHGFRYLELTGLAQPPTPDAVVARVFHSTSPVVGRFECSDPSLNQLMQNILWTQRSNMMGVTTDCPSRDERVCWLGDIQAFSQTAVFNMDMAAFFTKIAQDIRDRQADDGRYPDIALLPGDPNKDFDSRYIGFDQKAFAGAPAWADAGTIVPWRVYQNYADKRLLEEHFDSARRWVDYIHKANPDLIWEKGRNNDYNDWLNGNTFKQKDWPTQGASVPPAVFATAFFAHSTDIVAKMAAVLGRKEEAQRYGELFNQIKAAFNQRFVKPDGHIEGDTQAGYALALNFNLLPDELRPKAAQLLVEGIGRYRNHLSTGIHTTHRAMLELARNNHADVAWQLLTNRTLPSWLYMIDNGATTIWERWDGYVKGRGFTDEAWGGLKTMNVFNLWSLGSVGEWMWRHIAGLNPDDAQPGWKHFFIAPKPGGGVTWAKSEYQSIRGRIVSDWKIEGAILTLRAVVPPNTTATIQLPGYGGITVNGEPQEKSEFPLPAGKWEIVANQNKKSK
jgi:alpha-L-rhamnosidase